MYTANNSISQQISEQNVIEVPSPCTQICRINPSTQLCEGCSRTLAEIAQWSQLSNPKKNQILTAIAATRPNAAVRRLNNSAKIYGI